MYYNVVLFIFAVVITRCLSQNPLGCQVQDDDNAIDWQNMVLTHITIDDIDVIDLTFPYNGRLDIGTVTGSGADYIDVTAADGQLVFKTNDNFKQLDSKLPKQINSQYLISIIVPITCSAGSDSLGFIQYVRDTNNHAPTFAQPSYEFIVPMPLMPRIDFTTLGTSIIVEDLDFSNQDVTFTVDPPGNFILTTVSDPNSKQYRATISVNDFTRLGQDTTLIITAIDSGDVPKSSKATVTITIDKTISLPDIAPTFSAPYYTAHYSNETDPNTITLDQAIALTENADNVQIVISGDFADNFAIVQSSDNKLALSVVKNLDGDVLKKGDDIVLTLQATLTGEKSAGVGKGFSVVIIKLPQVNQDFQEKKVFFYYYEEKNGIRSHNNLLK